MSKKAIQIKENQNIDFLANNSYMKIYRGKLEILA